MGDVKMRPGGEEKKMEVGLFFCFQPIWSTHDRFGLATTVPATSAGREGPKLRLILAVNIDFVSVTSLDYVWA